jgi:hypothetical protein
MATWPRAPSPVFWGVFGRNEPAAPSVKLRRGHASVDTSELVLGDSFRGSALFGPADGERRFDGIILKLGGHE